MDSPSPYHLDDMMVSHAGIDDLFTDFNPNFVNYPQDISLWSRCVGSDDEVWSTQGVEVSGVIGHIEG